MKIIAFYLPQFHEIPENNQWWGKGFTEWTNTRKATPLFKNHYQPHTPLNNNYYNLLDDGVLEKQIDIAKKYGVDAFCFYHYWFKGGKKLLEKPLEYVLANKSLDFPFCICWANESWSRRWDGSNKEILIEQDYDDDENWKNHFYYLKQFFEDERYIKIDGHPVMLIYKPQEIPELSKKLSVWNFLAKQHGFGRIIFISQYPQVNKEIERLFDYNIEFEPEYTATEIRNHKFRFLFKNPLALFSMLYSKLFLTLKIRHYKKLSYKRFSNISSKRIIAANHLPGLFTSWDNTPRRKNGGIVYHGSSPMLFKRYASIQISKAKSNNCPFVFVNAWNEWAEGAHLEPDDKYGYDYLEALFEAKKGNKTL